MNVIIVQSEGAVKFLALEFILLEAFVVPFGHVREKGADVTDDTAVGIVVGDLLHASALGNYHSIIALMVLQVEMVGGVSGVAEGVISVVGQSHR